METMVRVHVISLKSPSWFSRELRLEQMGHFLGDQVYIADV